MNEKTEKQFIIFWDAGYGECAEIVYAQNIEQATGLAFESWKEEAESAADYGALEYTEVRAEEYGLE